MTANNSKYPESPRRLPYLRELLALVAVVLTVINVFATTTSGPRVRVRTYVQSPASHDADATNIWTSPRLQKAAMTPEESVHYKLDTDAGGVEWASVLPHGQGVVFLNSTGTSSDSSHSLRSSTSAARNGNGKAPYRVAMFHQLDCLNVLREEMVLLLRTSTHTSTSPDPPATSSSTPTPHRAQFCLNYLRESILCHADSHLERVRSEFGPEFGPEYESVQKGNGNGKGRERGRARGRAVVLGTERTDCVDWEGVWRGVEENWGEVMREEGREG